MGVTLYCFVFGVVSLRTAATVTVVLLLLSSSGSCVSPNLNLNLKPSLSFSLPSVSLHGRANPGPPPEDQDAAVGDPSTVGHLQAPPLIIPWRPLTAPACPTHASLGFCVSGRTNISDDLRDLLLKMLDKNPESRITIPQMKVKVKGRRSSGSITFWPSPV